MGPASAGQVRTSRAILLAAVLLAHAADLREVRIRTGPYAPHATISVQANLVETAVSGRYAVRTVVREATQNRIAAATTRFEIR